MIQYLETLPDYSTQVPGLLTQLHQLTQIIGKKDAKSKAPEADVPSK
jgi:hypothetical protein